MSTRRLTPDLIAALTAVDTATICNAIEIVEGRRATGGFTRKPFVAAFPSLPPILGFARTATIRAAAPNILPPAEAKALRIALLPPARGGGAGHRLHRGHGRYARHRCDVGRGSIRHPQGSSASRAALTNGSIRDLDCSAARLPADRRLRQSEPRPCACDRHRHPRDDPWPAHPARRPHPRRQAWKRR